MHQILFGVGVVAIASGSLAALYALVTGQPALAAQGTSLLISGCVFVTLRNIVAKLENLDRRMDFQEAILRKMQFALDDLLKKSN